MKHKKTGGRKAGTPNKTTAIAANMKALAGKSAPESIKVLVAIMHDTNTPAAARVSAAREILDRAAGKVPQALTDAEGGPLVQKEVHHHFHTDEAPQPQPEAQVTQPAAGTLH